MDIYLLEVKEYYRLSINGLHRFIIDSNRLTINNHYYHFVIIVRSMESYCNVIDFVYYSLDRVIGEVACKSKSLVKVKTVLILYGRFGPVIIM